MAFINGRNIPARPEKHEQGSILLCLLRLSCAKLDNSKKILFPQQLSAVAWAWLCRAKQRRNHSGAFLVPLRGSAASQCYAPRLSTYFAASRHASYFIPVPPHLVSFAGYRAHLNQRCCWDWGLGGRRTMGMREMPGGCERALEKHTTPEGGCF